MHQAVRAPAARTVATAVAGCSCLDDERAPSLGEIRARPGPPPYFVGEQFD